MIINIFKCLFDKRKRIINKLSLKKGDICIDCGANVGTITEMLVNKGCVVHAFEPNPYAYRVLEEKYAKNPRVHLYKWAVWNKNRTIKLYLHTRSNEDSVLWSIGSSLKSKKGNVDKDNYVKVKSIRLSDFIKKLKKKVKLLKIDIEGSEIEVINDLIDENVVDKIDYIFVETHDDKNRFLRIGTYKLRKRIKLEKLENIYLDWT